MRETPSLMNQNSQCTLFKQLVHPRPGRDVTVFLPISHILEPIGSTTRAFEKRGGALEHPAGYGPMFE
jgi:hypothetical protein